MGAEFSSVEPRPIRKTVNRKRAGMAAGLRQIHRWTSIVFTLTVAANFAAAMVRGPAPALITYSPLPPLLILPLTGLYMFARGARAERAATPLVTKG